MIGRTFSHYTVLQKLGAGGMGEIYKAQDTRLNRFVAMKVLSTANAGDVERRRRFVQEAQAASALNHPNIITIHDVLSTEGFEFMVMEFVSGVTLDDLIPKHGLNVQKTLDVAVQIADALQTAHAAGIVHRDLKPANVMVTGTGLVKILDFGIAKLTGPAPSGGSTDETLPIDSPMTVEGSILGTVCYMSPEQAQAKAVDPRSDIFSFGLVMYEMLTGQKAFSGDTALSTLSSILRDEAKPIGDLVQGVPPELEQIVHRAMRKSPDERWQSMQEMRSALIVLKQKADSGVLHTQLAAAPVTTAKKKTNPMILLVAASAVVVLAAGGGGTWWWMTHRQPPKPPATQAAPAPVAPPVAEIQPPAETAPPADQGMTNQDVLGLVGAKVPQVTIVNQIRAAGKTNFDLSTNGVIDLTKGGVPPQIIEVMRNPKAAPPSAPVTAVARPTPAAQPAPNKQTPSPALITPPPAAAAPATPPPAPTQPAPAAAPPVAQVKTTLVVVPDGKPFNLTLAADVPVKITTGQKINFTITNDVKIGDVVVIAKGTPVTGEVVDAGDAKKVLGIIGSRKATFKLSTVASAGGGKVAIRATPAHSDKSDHPIELPGTKSKDVWAHSGAEYMAYIDGEQTVTIRH
ncbi:MAG TPA: serine/threonine-protein kinase [Bryobacteraceae bacterium]|nr:serine/threonine-protein kinase [Bryobacteraceae bacterium]